MKRFILSLASLMLFTLAIAQQLPGKTYPKTIQVTGISELEVIPDQIHVAVVLKEYLRKGKEKVSIEQIRKTFLQNVRNAGIHDSLIKVMSYNGSSDVQWWKKKPSEDILLSSIAYEIVFTRPSDIEALVSLLDQEATDQFNVIQVTHTQIQILQKQLRINALKAAREKAGYLTEAIAEKVGSAVTITENYAAEPFMYKTALTNTMNRFEDTGGASMPGFKQIKLRSEINVVFELL